MESIIILSNPGSSSKKYSVYSENTEVAWFHFESQDTEYVCSYKVIHTFEKVHIQTEQYRNALVYVYQLLNTFGVITSQDDIKAIAIRTVVPHIDFTQDLILTPDIEQKLHTLQHEDPLHIRLVIEELAVIHEQKLNHIQVLLISDSSFHTTARRRIPIQSEPDLYTIGYHGLSCESVLQILSEKNIEHKKTIVCHLGGGSSISAIHNGKSVYNSMEYSPLGGTFMASRPGSVDPFIVLSLLKDNQMTYEDALTYLYTNSGLKAISKVSDDLRLVREEAFKGNQHAKQAIVQFVDSITSYILKASSYTNGVDTIVFTGTIGFRATYIREMIAEKLKWLGVVMHHDKNLEDIDMCFEISSFESKIKMYVVQINEMKEMHRHVQDLLKNKI